MGHISVRGINGTGIARTTFRSGGSVLGAAVAMYVFLQLALLAACVALVVVTGLLIVRVIRARRPVAPAVIPARVNDAAARTHRARMARILATR